MGTCMATYGNGGHTKLPSASRAFRFFGYVFEDMMLDVPCYTKHEVSTEFTINGDTVKL